MAIIKKKIAWWNNVGFASQYHVRIVPTGSVVDPTDQEEMEVIPFVVVAQNELDQIESNIAELGLDIEDGLYDVFVSAADQRENESNPLEFREVVLDFTPPPAPTVGGFRS